MPCVLQKRKHFSFEQQFFSSQLVKKENTCNLNLMRQGTGWSTAWLLPGLKVG
jgi:hypothetical protein